MHTYVRLKHSQSKIRIHALQWTFQIYFPKRREKYYLILQFKLFLKSWKSLPVKSLMKMTKTTHFFSVTKRHNHNSFIIIAIKPIDARLYIVNNTLTNTEYLIFFSLSHYLQNNIHKILATWNYCHMIAYRWSLKLILNCYMTLWYKTITKLSYKNWTALTWQNLIETRKNTSKSFRSRVARCQQYTSQHYILSIILCTVRVLFKEL